MTNRAQHSGAGSPENEDKVYADLAKWRRAGVPEPSARVYSITYLHDGDEWTATVGEQLRGIRMKTSRLRGTNVERSIRIANPAIVLAIFQGVPYTVVTNHRIAGHVCSRWEHPFMPGQPTCALKFRN